MTLVRGGVCGHVLVVFAIVQYYSLLHIAPKVGAQSGIRDDGLCRSERDNGLKSAKSDIMSDIGLNFLPTSYNPNPTDFGYSNVHVHVLARRLHIVHVGQWMSQISFSMSEPTYATSVRACIQRLFSKRYNMRIWTTTIELFFKLSRCSWAFREREAGGGGYWTPTVHSTVFRDPDKPIMATKFPPCMYMFIIHGH